MRHEWKITMGMQIKNRKYIIRVQKVYFKKIRYGGIREPNFPTWDKIIIFSWHNIDLFYFEEISVRHLGPNYTLIELENFSFINRIRRIVYNDRYHAKQT